MKKFILLIAFVLVASAFAGCGGGNNNNNNNPQTSRYTYEATYASIYLKNGRVQGKASGIAEIYTYEVTGETKTAVNSEYSCDPDSGTLSYIAGKTIFTPKKAGEFTVIATWNGNTLNIPIKVYHEVTFSDPYVETPTVCLDLDNMQWRSDESDPNVDLRFAGVSGRFYAPYGYLVLKQTQLPSVLSGPTGEYITSTWFDSSSYNQPYTTVVKTSEGRYAKLNLTSVGSLGDDITIFVSDLKGKFAY